MVKEFNNDKNNSIVLTEEYVNLYTVGHTSNYLKVYLKGDYLLNNEYLCKITRIENNMVFAEVVTCLKEKISL